jgi:hypothetical protein
MSVREQLVDFYREVKTRAPANNKDFSDIVGPDLIWVDDEYLNAPTRIAIIGQQVDGWDYTYPEFVADWEVNNAIEEYRKFDYGINYHSSPFWQFFHQVRTFQHGPNAGQRMLLWTNLVKFVSEDQSSILWKPYRDQALALQDDILVTELRLTSPDICIFVTGPDYDDIIERYYPGVQFQALTAPVREFAKLTHPDLPEKSYRCYHPKYLRLGGHWEPTIATLKNELGWAEPN